MTIDELIATLESLPAEVRAMPARVWDSDSGEWALIISVSAYDSDSLPSVDNPVDINVDGSWGS